MAVDLYPGQMDALGQLETGRILCGDVGSGKSIVALAWYYTRICGGPLKINGVGENGWRKQNVPLYIITTAKKRDSGEWEKELGRFAISADEVVVDSWNNITKYESVTDACFLFDEQRLVGSGRWVKSFYKIAKRNDWLILSATPGDVWMDYVPVFVANGFFANKTQFNEAHVVYSYWGGYPKIERYVDTKPLEKLRKHLLVQIPFTRHTTRYINDIITDFDKEEFDRIWNQRWHTQEDRPIMDAGEMFRLARKLVNTDPSRLEAVLSMVSRHPRLIIFYNFNYELEALLSLRSKLGETGVQIAQYNGRVHEAVPEDGSWLYLVQYTAGSEGWECRTTDAMMFFSLNYSYKVWHQAMGRIDRFNTPFSDLYYYVLRSQSPIDKAIWRANRAKKTFNQRGFLSKMEVKT